MAARIPGGIGSVEVRPIAEDDQTLRALGFLAPDARASQRGAAFDLGGHTLSPKAEEELMKYLCLVYMDEKSLDAVPDSDCMAFEESVRKSGRDIAGEALQRVATATTVRVRDGKVSLTDGPFAETKEQLAGFYLIDAKDLDDAIQVAAKIPPARVGSIEVRPVRELSAT